jgi:signal transduction histidine kinase
MTSVNPGRRIDLRWVDRLFAALLAVDFVLEALLADGVPNSRRVVTALFAVPFAAPVALRRRSPAGALPAAGVIVVIQQLLHGQLFTTLPSESAELVPILCAYGAGAWLELKPGALTLLTGSALFYGNSLIDSYVDHVPGAGNWIDGLANLVFFTIASWVVGCLVRERGRRAAAFASLEAAALQERQERLRAAIAEERIVIGRELQDIIAHSVSVMVVHAGGARRLVRSDPDRAHESILTVEQTGRQTLAEMRRLLGLLRREDDPRALAPQPGLEQLPELADALRARGLECSIETTGEPIALTPGIDLVGYRAIESALDLAAGRGCTHAETAVRYSPRWLELEVRGDCALRADEGSLAALSERVELYGGRLERVGDGDGEFTVRCVLPLEAAQAAIA